MHKTCRVKKNRLDAIIEKFGSFQKFIDYFSFKVYKKTKKGNVNGRETNAIQDHK
jgi:hypothetical protein